MSDEIKLLSSLSNTFGPPGHEAEVRAVLRKNLEPYADEVKEDALGNILFYHHGKDAYPKVMLAAHMDEVGLMVTFIESTGFLRFESMGITSNIMLGQRLLLQGAKGFLRGIVGTKPPHLMTEEERRKVIPTEDLFIDIGASSLEEAEGKGAEVGTMGVFDVEFAEMGEGYIMGKSFDGLDAPCLLRFSSV